jgi:hypothetical protein
MAGYIPAPPNPAADIAAAIFLKGISGFAKGFQERNVMSDQKGVLDYLDNLQKAQQYGGLALGSMAGGPMGGAFGSAVAPDMSSAVTPPTMKTREGMGMLLDLQLGRMLSPLQQAQLGESQAQADYYRAHAEALRNPQPKPMAQPPQRLGKDNPYGLAEGSVVQFSEGGDMRILWSPPNAKVNQTEFESAVELLGDPERWSKLSPDQQEAYRYKAGLQSRPPSFDQKTWDEKLNYWQTIFRQTYKPGEMGAMMDEVIPGLEGLHEKANAEIQRLLANPEVENVRMVHPRTGQTGLVPPGSVLDALQKGYQIPGPTTAPVTQYGPRR